MIHASILRILLRVLKPAIMSNLPICAVLHNKYNVLMQQAPYYIII